MSIRLEEIRKKNAGFEKGSPYNFCDCWCQRYAHEKQVRCALYKDELDEEDAIDFDDLPQDIQHHIKFVENNPYIYSRIEAMEESI